MSASNPSRRIVNSVSLLNIAEAAYERTLTTADETFPNQIDGPVAVVFYAAALEALVIETVASVTSPNFLGRLFPQVAQVLREMPQNIPALRLAAVLRASLSSPYNKGSRPYQDWALLVGLRNEIVHIKVEQFVIDQDGVPTGRTNILNKLQPLGVLGVRPNVPDDVLGFLDRIQTRGIAAWARGVAEAVAQDLHGAMPEPLRHTIWSSAVQLMPRT